LTNLGILFGHLWKIKDNPLNIDTAYVLMAYQECMTYTELNQSNRHGTT